MSLRTLKVAAVHVGGKVCYSPTGLLTQQHVSIPERLRESVPCDDVAEGAYAAKPTNKDTYMLVNRVMRSFVLTEEQVEERKAQGLHISTVNIDGVDKPCVNDERDEVVMFGSLKEVTEVAFEDQIIAAQQQKLVGAIASKVFSAGAKLNEKAAEVAI